jgi:hypothetical protein
MPQASMRNAPLALNKPPMSGPRGALFMSARRMLANTFGIASWLAGALAKAGRPVIHSSDPKEKL